MLFHLPSLHVVNQLSINERIFKTFQLTNAQSLHPFFARSIRAKDCLPWQPFVG